MSEAQTNATPIVLDPMRVAFAPDATVLQLGRTHFIGIGGAGMSVLAEMLHERGVDVDGSDREEGSKTERLRSLGITVEIGQQADNVRGADTVVYSSAIKPDNPEIVAAHERGIRIVHRSDILALLMNGRRAVTVAGAHGKTTTSSLLSHILVHAGTGELADPSYAIGGTIQAPGSGTGRRACRTRRRIGRGGGRIRRQLLQVPSLDRGDHERARRPSRPLWRRGALLRRVHRPCGACKRTCRHDGR